jgi:hypothetical protein
MSLTSFKYKILVESDSFRIILLEPSVSHDAPLQCKLLHTTLSLCDRDIIDHYTALSYVWGDATQRGQISIEDVAVDITATLEAALRDLRDRNRAVRVWADALCINQGDNDEKAIQVGLMAKIYGTAHHTVVHLGPRTTNADVVLTIAPSNTTGTVSNHYSWLQAETAGDEILKLTWFSRVWIFQELVLSSDPWVQMGDLRARWKDVCSILLAKDAQTIQGVNAVRRKVLKDMDESRSYQSRKIMDLLLSRRGLGATNPRDMIFGHWSMASDRSELEEYVKIDYSKSCEVIYENVARYLLDHVAPYAPDVFFQHLDNVEPASRRQNLASWAPDWSISAPNLEPMYHDTILSHQQLKAIDHYVFVGDPWILAYVGYEVDVVKDVSLTLPRSADLFPARREAYQKAVTDLQAFYRDKGGVWWSGDTKGRYRHISLKGREEEHEERCLKLANEWIDIVTAELPKISSPVSANELESHENFVPEFKKWLQLRAAKGLIMVGGDSDHLESLMFKYLHPNNISNVIEGRKLFTTESGRVGVAPKHTKAGDIVVYLAGTLKALVIRRTGQNNAKDLDRAIRQAFQTKKKGGDRESKEEVEDDEEEEDDEEDEDDEEEEDDQDEDGVEENSAFDMDRTDVLPIQHGILIGESYVEGVVGWLVEPEEVSQYSIFALR